MFRIFQLWLYICVVAHLATAQDLPLEIQADLLETEAQKFIQSGNWSGAVESMKKLLELNTSLPNDFHYKYANVLDKAGDAGGALKQSLIFLQKNQGTGAEVISATNLMLQLKNTKLPARRVIFPPALPSSTRADLLRKSIQFNEDGKHFAHAAVDYEHLKEIGADLPSDFTFLLARARLNSGDDSGKELLTQYMKEAGRNAPYYKEALSLYVDSKIDTKPKPWVIPQFELELLWCPPGSFVMGSPENEEDRDEDEVQHKVTLTKGFWIGKYEVTQAQWQKLMGNNPSAFKDPKRPVERISWYDATEFCERLTIHEQNAGRLPSGMVYKLPTEAQWEYACRAGTQTVFCFGDALSCTQANLDGDYPYGTASRISYLERTVPVGSYTENLWGIHDMHGNVWEWCSDWYGEYPTEAVTDPQGATIGRNRVYRGGSWGINGQYCRSAFRYWFTPDYKSNKLGFRICLAPAP